MKQTTIYPSATVANMVCGFDVLGFALEEPCDKMTVRLLNEKTVRVVHHDSYGLPTQPEKNVAGVALQAVLNQVKENIGFEVEITKVIKPGSGIGSSAASAAGAVYGANILLGNIFSKTDLVRLAMFGEEVASGAQHADNIAPCIFGGVTLVRSLHPLDVVEVDFPELQVTVIHPQLEIKTSEARKLLKPEVPLGNAVKQWANVGALVAGLMKHDYELITRSLHDYVAEPVRSALIPRFDELKKHSLEAGALGGGISGSGPSVFMLSKNANTAHRVADAMRKVYNETGVDFHVHVTTINRKGVKEK
ncbi:MAG: homoserine kinase [Chitinophagales bacterium]|nr:homoserine kinase [Chitinophagales bacterium]